MKKASFFGISAVCIALFWVGCGGGDSNRSQDTLSHIQNRAFVTNQFFSNLVIVNADTDRPSNFNVTVGANPSFIVQTPDKKNLLVYAESSVGVVTLVSADTETVTASTSLASFSESVAMTSDAKTAFAAVKNAPVTGASPGGVQVIDNANSKITFTIAAEGARWLALNHAGNRLLVFSDQSDVVRMVDLTATTPAATVVPGPFSRPMAAYFSADDSKAYILSCGSECGATGAVPPDTKANVTELTIATGATRTVSVKAATVGLLDGNTLYVAGAPGGSGGTLDTVDVTTMTNTSSVDIGPGLHKIMKLAAGKLWVGATGCGSAEGCLSIVTPGGSVIVDTPPAGQTTKGNVTGIAEVSGRNRMYVVEGGQLRAYDSSNGGDVTPFSLDVRGALFDVATVP